MNTQETPVYERFHQQLFWLDGWFQEKKKAILPLINQEQETIFDTLSQQWKQRDVIALLNALAEQFGKEKVVEIVEMVVAENARAEWAEIAREEGSNTIDDLVRILLEPLRDGQGFEFTLEERDGGVQMHCTQCSHVELAKEVDGREWLYYLVCGGDPYIVEGFNPKMGFQRTKTLMEGHDCCNHFYFMKD